ncbi:hypothetical protein IscW_ISCW020996, partial [Ixodes scapularis]
TTCGVSVRMANISSRNKLQVPLTNARGNGARYQPQPSKPADAATTTRTAISAAATARCGVLWESERSLGFIGAFFLPAPWAPRNPRSHSRRPCPKKRPKVPPASAEAKYSASSENNET